MNNVAKVCKICRSKSVFNDLCKLHFIEYFESKVYDCIDKYELIPENSKILVGVSGGKDSLTILYLLNKRFSNVTAYTVDEGIAGYRDKTLEDAKKFCKIHNIPMIVESVEDNFGFRLDEAVPNTQKKPCNICGIMRRYLLNKHKEYDLLATGHNMDDEVQSILMNLMKNQIALLARLGPKPGIISSDKFLQRIKPLYFCSEKEVMVYSYLMGFKMSFIECPFAKLSFRAFVRDTINEYENKFHGTKKNVVDKFMGMIPKLREVCSQEDNLQPLNLCIECGEPSAKELCNACSLKKEFRPLILMQ